MIMPREWDDDVESMAAMVERHATRDQPPRIVIVGYSYGGGWTAPRLARALQHIGRDVDLMILIDPVWRSRFLAGKWLSFTGSIQITVPGNVRHIISWRQRNGGLFDPKGSSTTNPIGPAAIRSLSRPEIFSTVDPTQEESSSFS